MEDSEAFIRIERQRHYLVIILQLKSRCEMVDMQMSSVFIARLLFPYQDTEFFNDN